MLNPEIKEKPSLKIQNLDENEVLNQSRNRKLALLRVKRLSEMGILPSRASLFSAGYDLSSATRIIVPARGKAMVPTDLSIGIPEGTYARIGMFHSVRVGFSIGCFNDKSYVLKSSIILYPPLYAPDISLMGQNILPMLIDILFIMTTGFYF
ncbi:hypothetical protein GIB67_017454 [Kingdonia uniflora]|uniref:dUTP diphosphatase n=1 Tax=Kingdonia uniflora TaxID=39325 RepID=A0A7J7M499_9MAGN|nr:hypothetical protein GIB67_017454 [Kingdonia uniflora]